ncbi:hypothetical protein [Vulcanisaeta distributa]|nr:hypothetical protein [Vulcanisaeta distributa]
MRPHLRYQTTAYAMHECTNFDETGLSYVLSIGGGSLLLNVAKCF